MFHFKILSCHGVATALTLVLLYSPLVTAADTVVNVTANILASSCDIAAGSVDQNVDLGKGRLADLTHAKDATPWTSFSVELTHCPTSASTVTATMSGTPVQSAPEYYLNTGTATDIAIEVMDEAGQTPLGNGATLNIPVDAQRNAVFSLKGRMISLTGKPTSGTVAGVMDLSFTLK